jgi:diketogulonate reductase-like aldo/keto reductase
MNKPLHQAAVLPNGVAMPWLGLGVYDLSEGDAVEQVVLWALAKTRTTSILIDRVQ